MTDKEWINAVYEDIRRRRQQRTLEIAAWLASPYPVLNYQQVFRSSVSHDDGRDEQHGD